MHAQHAQAWTHHPPVLDDLVHDAAHRVRGDGKAKAGGGEGVARGRSVYTHQAAVAVKEGAARVPWMGGIRESERE